MKIYGEHCFKGLHEGQCHEKIFFSSFRVKGPPALNHGLFPHPSPLHLRIIHIKAEATFETSKKETNVFPMYIMFDVALEQC